jgi:hypothetical protein
MNTFKKSFSQFINEASTFDMRVGDYAECKSNFAKITPVKGKFAKIIRTLYKYDKGVRERFFVLEFDTPLIDRRGPEPIETNIIEINTNQIKNIKVICGRSYERIKAGYTLKYKASIGFIYILNTIGFNPRHNYYDISYFDTDDKGNITMLPASKADLVPEEEKYTSKFRQTTKINRVLLKLNDEYSEKQIENFGTEFKAIWSQINENLEDRIQVVNGDAITFWYHEKNYYSTGLYRGTLNKSCMRYERTQPRVAFYSKYPNKIALCILLDETKSKLLARALVWKLDTPKNVIFMDRIYYILPVHENILSNYAHKMGWATKIDGYNTDKKLAVDIKYTGNIELLPYLDTLRNVKKDEITN